MNINIKIINLVMILSGTLTVLTADIYSQPKNRDSLTYNTDNIKPELYGHQYVINSLIQGPFLNTTFSLTSGIGTSSNYDQPLVINGKEITGLFGQLTYGSFNAQYRQKIKDWLAFSVSANFNGQLGSQRISIITEGINIGTSLNFGWIIKAYQSKKLMLGASANISNQSVTIFNMYDFVNKIIQNGEITPDNKLVKTINLTAGLLGLSTAYAFNRTFGAIGKFNFGYGESISSVNRGYFDAGISIDANFNPKHHIPIGFALGYDWNNFGQEDVSIKNPQNILFKINYTGRKDFDLGVEMNTQFFTLTRLNQDINIEVFNISAGIAYYF